MQRTQIVAGNWKMNKTAPEATALATQICQYIDQHPLATHQRVVLCPPNLYIASLQAVVADTPNTYLGAQNCHTHTLGAYTGEVSAAMVQSIGASYVIVGHSERREYHHETNALLRQKVDAVVEQQLQLIFCCGESLSQRDNNTHEAWLAQQLHESLFHLNAQQMQQVIIAYEPIWAIGTGKTATPEQAQQTHAYLRHLFAQQYGNHTAQQTPLLYGGSCNASNAASLLSQPDIDGGLIGGAALKTADFAAIIAAMKP